MSSLALYFICGSNETLSKGKQHNLEEENRDGKKKVRSMNSQTD